MTNLGRLHRRVASLHFNLSRSEGGRGQAGQGRRGGGKRSALRCVTRSRLTGNAGMRCATLLLSVAAVLVLGAVEASPAAAAGPQWTVTSVARPTNFAPGDASGQAHFVVILTNTGSSVSSGPVEITDELPEGLRLDPTGASAENVLAKYASAGSPAAGFTCVLRTCTFTPSVAPSQSLILTFPVDVSAAPFADSCEVPAGADGCLTNVVHVSGGGSPAATVETPTVISQAPASFGISPGGAATALSTLQAGAHPDLTTSIAFNTTNFEGSLAGDPKDTIDDLPPALRSSSSRRRVLCPPRSAWSP
jgi:uncharacterized repeat protein (TIGR01451 family)